MIDRPVGTNNAAASTGLLLVWVFYLELCEQNLNSAAFLPLYDLPRAHLLYRQTVEEIYLSELTPSDRDAFGTLHRLMESFRMKSLYQYVGKSYWDGAFRHLLAKK